jgi:hypothetical protein
MRHAAYLTIKALLLPALSEVRAYLNELRRKEIKNPRAVRAFATYLEMPWCTPLEIIVLQHESSAQVGTEADERGRRAAGR